MVEDLGEHIFAFICIESLMIDELEVVTHLNEKLFCIMCNNQHYNNGKILYSVTAPSVGSVSAFRGKKHHWWPKSHLTILSVRVGLNI